jgi:hypothetical protein
MAVPTAPYYEDVRLPGSGGLRIPTEANPAGLDVYKELDLTATTGTVTLTPSQAASSLITATPTANMTIVFPGCQPGKITAIMNLASATYSITCEVSGNTTNTAVVSADTNALVVQTGSNSGMAVLVAS